MQPGASGSPVSSFCQITGGFRVPDRQRLSVSIQMKRFISTGGKITIIRLRLRINIFQTNEIPGYHHNSGRKE